jgi:hypothetical protein
VEVVKEPNRADLLLLFASTQAEMEQRLLQVKPVLREQTMAWVAYPKGSRRAGHDVSRDTIWSFAESIDLKAVASISLDDTWSAMRIRPTG